MNKHWHCLCLLISKYLYKGESMKHFLFLAILTSLYSFSALAEGQTETECPMMREMNKRVNTKANLSNDAKKPVHLKGHKASSV